MDKFLDRLAAHHLDDAPERRNASVAVAPLQAWLAEKLHLGFDRNHFGQRVIPVPARALERVGRATWHSRRMRHQVTNRDGTFWLSTVTHGLAAILGHMLFNGIEQPKPVLL